jgi:hypothetical protein
MLPDTNERVSAHTAPEINEQIKQRTAENISHYAAAGSASIGRRLAEVEREWGIERTVKASAATIALAGLGLGARARNQRNAGITCSAKSRKTSR